MSVVCVCKCPVIPTGRVSPRGVRAPLSSSCVKSARRCISIQHSNSGSSNGRGLIARSDAEGDGISSNLHERTDEDGHKLVCKVVKSVYGISVWSKPVVVGNELCSLGSRGLVSFRASTTLACSR